MGGLRIGQWMKFPISSDRVNYGLLVAAKYP